ncbi:MAG: flagellar type III secretion system pore protein FliP [Longimicrobiales bacterium]
MTTTSALGVVGALLFILGLVLLVAWAARRFTPGARGGAGLDLRVEARTAVAPRQGVATVRVGHRRVLVSYGEGGVRMLLELDQDRAVAGEDAEAADAPSDEVEVRVARFPRAASDDGLSRPLGGGLSGIPFKDTFNRVLQRRGLKVFFLVVMMGAAMAAPVHASAAATGTVATAIVAQDAAAPRAPTVRQPRAPGQGTVSAPQVAVTVDGGSGSPLEVSGPVGTVLFIGFMTLIPTLLLLMTGFTRILIVLHLLKQALGTQTAPPGHLLAAMALLLTGFVMAPTFQQVHETAVVPWMDGQMDELEMLRTAESPMRAFMLESTREQDLVAFLEMRGGPAPTTVDEIPLVVLTSAFVTSELTAAFQMGFALFLPFVVIDLVVASVLMSMGMFMLPPVMVSLPFKLLLFVLVDGWSLVLGSIVQSF